MGSGISGAFQGTRGGSKRSELLSNVQNPKLRNAIDEMYRPGAKVGDGGLADAIRHELNTGELVGGKSHIQKGWDRLRSLENILNKQQSLNSIEKTIIQTLINELKNVLEGD